MVANNFCFCFAPTRWSVNTSSLNASSWGSLWEEPQDSRWDFVLTPPSSQDLPLVPKVSAGSPLARSAEPRSIRILQPHHWLHLGGHPESGVQGSKQGLLDWRLDRGSRARRTSQDGLPGSLGPRGAPQFGPSRVGFALVHMIGTVAAVASQEQWLPLHFRLPDVAKLQEPPHTRMSRSRGMLGNVVQR